MSREETTFLGRKQAGIAAGRLAYHTCLVLFCSLALIGHLSCEREREREREREYSGCHGRMWPRLVGIYNTWSVPSDFAVSSMIDLIHETRMGWQGVPRLAVM
jgi:hypothetical protein